MASLTVAPASTTQVTWSITGLGNPFNTNHYMSVLLSSGQSSFGAASQPLGVLTSTPSTAAPSSGSSTTAGPYETTGTAFSPGNTYTLYGTARSSNGLYYPAGSAVITMPTLPGAVTNLAKASSTTTTLTVSWTAASGASGYNMYRDDVLIASPGSSPYTFSGLSANTEYKITCTPYNSWGGGTSQTIFASTSPARPSNFAWTNTKTSGGTFNLTAAEWNALTSRINDFRTYRGLSVTTFASAGSGNNFTAATFNQARNAIAAMSPSTSPPGTVFSGAIVTASALNGLRDSLNSIT